MSTEQIVTLLLIGIAAGFASSMIGIGGGLVIVPALVFFYGMDQKLAQGTSLMVIALPVAAVGAYTYYKNGNANWQASLIVAATFMIGGYFGGLLANKLETTIIKKIFAVFMIAIALKYLFIDKPKPDAKPSGSAASAPASANGKGPEKQQL
jgi:uncharacterized membrane protein YfcA